MPLPLLPLFHPVSPENRSADNTPNLIERAIQMLRKLAAELQHDGPSSIVNLERAMNLPRALGL